jgi:hypothetical protein
MGIVIVLLTTLLLTAMGAALALASAMEVTIAGHFQRGHEVRHAAAGAFELGALELRSLPDWNGVLDGSVRSASSAAPPTGVRRVAGQAIDLNQLKSLLDCQQLTPCTNAAVAAITAVRPWGADNPRWRLFREGPWTAVAQAPSPLYTVVLVADDAAEDDGDPSRDALAGRPGAGRIRARAEAFGPTGAHAAVEALLERNAANPSEMRVLAWHFVAAGTP